MTAEEIVSRLKDNRNPENVKGMARFGISSVNTLGIPMPVVRQIAKESGKSHATALELWKTGIHEARILAALIDEPKMVTESQMESWVKDFDSWDVCDQCCMNLFDKTSFAYHKAFEWSERKEEFVKRAGFTLMAALAVHDKKAPDECLAEFLPVIEREAWDERNFVKKAVNWALRQIGKRNGELNKLALASAARILEQDTKAAKWIARDAIKELSGEKMAAYIKKRVNI